MIKHKPLTIGVSSRALFSIEDGHQVFEEKGQEAFDQYMQSKEDIPLRPGPAFPLIKKLLAMNTTKFPNPRDRVEVVLLSRNSPTAGMRIMNSVHHYNLDIERAAFCSGEDRFRLNKAFGIDLFLSLNEQDVSTAIQSGIAAAKLIPREEADFCTLEDFSIRIAFDGDAVVFSDEADQFYREHGLLAFRDNEVENVNTPLQPGPFQQLLLKLIQLQKSYVDHGECPLKIALVTARGMPAHGRVLKTLRSWGSNVDEAIFAGGSPKGPLLQALGVDMFFDDTEKNIASADSYNIASGHVPYGNGAGITRND